ncbi:Hypothetical protein FKW44_021846 [Caligus rogercresseyi]|uniref:Uncharacterized protein n=1 Tax=Caligus rogercresseyi TaxID=217165 RepID=A0A7T8GRX5_CALRO|nr:Hypothetical protein FKW44_021846 [Caligus rogercresseyi]
MDCQAVSMLKNFVSFHVRGLDSCGEEYMEELCFLDCKKGRRSNSSSAIDYALLNATARITSSLSKQECVKPTFYE